MGQDSAISQRFVIEAREHLAAMSAALITLERDPVLTQPLIDQLLRACHSIKGGAGFTGRRNIERLAHQTEEVLEHVRDGAIPVTPDMIDVLLLSVDRIGAMVDDVDQSEQVDVSEALGRLGNLLPSALARTPVDQPRSGSTNLDFTMPATLPAAVVLGELSLFGVRLDLLACERERSLGPADVLARLSQVGAVVESRTQLEGPPLDAAVPTGPLWLLAAVMSTLSEAQFATRLDISIATVVTLKRKNEVRQEQAVPRAEARPKPPAAATSMRISVPLIDRMMSLAGELVLVRNQAIRSTPRGDPSLSQLLRRLDAVTNELQDAALRLRTQPVGTLFDRFPRMVRDLARQLGKEINVEISGAEVELDKSIIELLSDPLTHLIRNCCDHGIETPERRAASGKPSAGRVQLSARQERGQIVIEVRDDGKGIDAAAVKRKAIEQKLRSAQDLAQLEDKQIYELILMSGFSTAAQVTDVSGRGVGMDVVKTNVEQVGGVVEIDSFPGGGSVFTLRLPLTLAIMPCLLVGSEGQVFAIPQRDVEEIVLLSAERPIESAHEGEVFRWRGLLAPVVRLASVLQLAGAHVPASGSAADDPSRFVVILRAGPRRFALVVAQVLESENLVVKPLHPLLRPLGVYAATTILGDGSVAAIFNSDGLARHGGVYTRSQALELPGSVEASTAATGKPTLLVRYGPRELLALSMDSIRRVVSIDPSRIERVGMHELINLDGAAVNVLRPDRFLSLSAPEDASLRFIVLPRSDRLPAGLVVSEVVDARDLPPDVDDRAFRSDGVLGTALVDGDIALLLDFDRLLEMWDRAHHGDSLATPALPSPVTARVLVVDDTQFFQRVVGELLRSRGYEVATAADGAQALSLLRGSAFSAVVSDLEMPVMDGLTLARNIRADESLRNLPLVALTTLNTDDSRAQARNAGFDAFEVKLDRAGLVRTVESLLAARTQFGGPR